MEQYVDLGCETRSQNRLNRSYTDSITFEMRIVDSKPANTTTELFGRSIAAPIIASALTQSRILNRIKDWQSPYLHQIAAGVRDARSIMTTGAVGVAELRNIVAQGGPVIHIVPPFESDARIMDELKQAEELGCVAVGLDIDAFFGEKAWDETPGPADLTHKSLADIERFCRATSLPFVVKGILSVRDARLAQEAGAQAIVVSNHGGEAIDYAVPILRILPAIREAAPSLTIMVDSGFRRGSDVLKALALGADCVGITTLLLIACAANGQGGVTMMMELLYEELGRTMSLVGCASVGSIDESILHFPFRVP
jgi:isopentenyl diphosphate isomerase/L-lactate dehydrogenase-like FMN-dependent dehydrogenase